jgi:hypothetical protein
MTHRRAQQPAVRFEVQQIRPEFLTYPERAVVHTRNGLDIEIRAGQPLAIANGRIDRNLRSRCVVKVTIVDRSVGDVRRIEEPVRIAERCEAVDLDRPARGGAIAGGLELGCHLVEPNHEVRAVALRAEAIVRKSDETPGSARGNHP